MKKKPKILFIDDDFVIREIVDEILSVHDYTPIIENEKVNIDNIFKLHKVDAVITDINMPGITGIEILEKVRKIDSLMPVIILTGSTNTEIMMKAIKLGAYDYLKKPFNVNELLITVNQAVSDRKLRLQNEEYKIHLEEMVDKRTKQLQEANKQIETALIRSIMSMINALEASDKYTKGHSERVTNLSILIAKSMGLSAKNLNFLRLGALMHDIGKIGISHTVLHKPSKLTHDEFLIMKKHPTIGEKIVEPIKLPTEVVSIISQHHEKLDGSGYPNGLTKDEISPGAKIVAVADAFDAITTDRPYRKGVPFSEGLKEIINHTGSQFDETVVAHFKKIFKKITEEELNKSQFTKEIFQK